MIKLSIAKLVASAPLDPYWVWAEKTNFRDYSSEENEPKLTVVGRLRSDLKLCESISETVEKAVGQNVTVSQIYDRPIGKDRLAMHVVVQPLRSQLNLLDKAFDRWELSQVVTPQTDKGRDDNLEWLNNEPRLIVGVVDDFIGFAHSKLKGKFRKIWCQDKKSPQVASKNWLPCGVMGYGFELVAKTNRFNLTSANYPTSQPRFSHGSHIASKILDMTGASKNVAGIAVLMPKQVVADTSGGAMAAQILDGVRYIVSQARAQDQIVINISYGTYAGPHDGTSLIEKALDELIEAYAGRLQIVFPSGNQYELQTHARVRLDGKGSQKKRLKLRVHADDRTPSFVELWMPQDSAKHLQITLISPSHKKLTCGFGQSSFLSPARGVSSTTGIIFPKTSALSEKSSGALIAFAATGSTSGKGDFAEHGIWSIELETKPKGNVPPTPIFIDAYVERDDTFGRPLRGRQAYFVDFQYEKTARKPGQPVDTATEFVQRDGSLNSIVTGQLTISAGAYVIKQRRPSVYSGGGFVREKSATYRPHLIAPADDSLLRNGVLGAGVYGRSVTRMNGTSVAAAIVSGHVAASMLESMENGKIAMSISIGVKQNSHGKTKVSLVPVPVPIKGDGLKLAQNVLGKSDPRGGSFVLQSSHWAR